MGKTAAKTSTKATDKAGKAPKASTKTAGRKAWTVMVYMAGDNNLDPDGVQDLKEMKRVGSTDQLDIVAQFDRAAGHVARRYHLRQGGIVTGDAVASLGAVNTGDPKNLSDFIQWAVKGYPAEHYLLVLWNHGQGWDDSDVYAGERHRALRRLANGPIRHALFHAPVRQLLNQATHDAERRAILLDDNAKDFLDNQELAKVMAGAAKLIGRKIDILGMDACLMSMAEVGYQVCDSAEYTVGSEQTEPGEGWPYHTVLAALAKQPTMSPRELSALIVEKYLAYYPSANDPSSGSVTQAACDLAKAPALAKAVAALAKALKRSLAVPAQRQRVLMARMQAQSYDVRDNIDLVDFCSLLIQGGAEPAVASACQQVMQAVKTDYVVAQGFKGKDMKHSNGVSIYFPTQGVSPLYPGLAFSKKTGWDAFLSAYLNAFRSRVF
ncbi:MAG: peptidase C11 [Ideonella sp.]|nr:peptidase C11 [Ideonella sp.]